MFPKKKGAIFLQTLRSKPFNHPNQPISRFQNWVSMLPTHRRTDARNTNLSIRFFEKNRGASREMISLLFPGPCCHWVFSPKKIMVGTWLSDPNKAVMFLLKTINLLAWFMLSTMCFRPSSLTTSPTLAMLKIDAKINVWSPKIMTWTLPGVPSLSFNFYDDFTGMMIFGAPELLIVGTWTGLSLQGLYEFQGG